MAEKPKVGPASKKLVKQGSGPTSTGLAKGRSGTDVFDAITAAKESVDKGLKGVRGAKKSKKLPSTSSGGSSNKGNEVKAKNFYN